MSAHKPKVAVTERSVVVIDDLLNTPIRLYYDPRTFRWRAFVLKPNGAFYREVTALSVCVCAVAEYCSRRDEGGNVYVDVCYCEEISLRDISLMFQPHWTILAAYNAGDMRTYRRWQRAVVMYVADYIEKKVEELWESAEVALSDAFGRLKNIEIDYYGYKVTAYKYCPGYYYGIFCRMKPRGCTETRCRDICDVGDVDCKREKLEECEKQKKVIPAYEA